MAFATVRSITPALALAASAIACGGESPIARFTPQRAPHEAYAESLKDAGLDKSAVGEAWLANANEALQRAPALRLPVRETGYFDPLLPAAAGYRFDLPRGRALAIDVTLESARPTRLFIDLFRVTESGFDRVAGAEEGRLDFRYVSRADGAYVLRLQPELLGGGRYTITQRSESSLGFPVPSAGERGIQSVFGDARDGGRRDHHGLDIFAPRGTPVVAVAGGVVSRVDTTEIGGRVVWLYDTLHGQSIYYAHLNDWAVQSGQQVKAGDVVGYVGNTGNARSTPPHLHFGIYSRGPVDPLPFIRASDREPAAPAVPARLIGRWARVDRAPAALRPAPHRSDPIARLPASTALHLRAAVGDTFRVSLPDGTEGFVAASFIAPLDRALRSTRATSDARVLAGPSASSPAMLAIEEGTALAIFAEFNGFLLARLPGGERGWVDRTMIRP